MDDVILARHGESEWSARRLVGGDSPLTAQGREQALALGAQLAGCPLDLCVTSSAMRALQTAELALAERAVPITVVSELGDVAFGEFTGRPLEEYRQWIVNHPPTEAPAGGESRVATLRRFACAFRGLLLRTERRILVVAHGLTIRALRDERPRPVVAGAPYVGAVGLTRSELELALTRLEHWCESPCW
jgi:broad specificity phosphatase PhoE